MLKLLDISQTKNLNSYSLLTNKNWLKKGLEKFTDQTKKAKKSTGKLELNFL